MRKCWPRNCGRNNTFISVSPPQDSGSGLNLRRVLRITFIFSNIQCSGFIWEHAVSSFLVCDTKNQLTVSFTWNARLSNSTKEWQNQGCYFNNLSDSLKFCESGPGASQHSHSDVQTGGDLFRDLWTHLQSICDKSVQFLFVGINKKDPQTRHLTQLWFMILQWSTTRVKEY